MTTIDWIARSQELKPGIRNLIDGRWSESIGHPLRKDSPRDGTCLYQLGAGNPSEAVAAVASAKRAFEDGRWSKLPSSRRKEVLFKLAALIDEQREKLALLESLDVGKPITTAISFDVPICAQIIRFSAEAADKVHGKVFGADHSSLTYQLRRPIGVVAGIIGWNFPIVLAASKIGPALATGNSLVLKPSEITSLSAQRVAELALEAGVPQGVLNVIHGDGAVGAALAHHRDVDLITFTGSTNTGKQLLIASGESNMKRLILECGGKAPSIVFDDCPDLASVADAIVARAFWNQGQVCTASSRVLVQESMKEKLMPLVIERISALKPGDPLCSETTFGALVSKGHQKKVLGYIEGGENAGARIAYRSSAPVPNEQGFYVAPIVFEGVLPEHTIARDEIFGPVLSVLSFKDEEDAVRIANDSLYGLSAILWTKDLGRAHRVSYGIKAGWITVNATGDPKGGSGGAMSVGGHKESGIGVEGGIEGLEAYTSQTAVQYFV